MPLAHPTLSSEARVLTSPTALALFAALPIAVVLVVMLGLGWGSTRAGFLGWGLALAVASLFFGAGPALLWYSQLKGLLLALYVLYIIWFALALFRVVDEAEALASISAGVTRLTADRALQLLVLGWVFASFLQGVTGFGVPVAVVAPLLVGLGFPPAASVVAASIGHAWAVTFGSLASAFYAMLAVTGLAGSLLAPASAALLGLACLLCGAGVALADGGRAGLRHAWPAVAVLGLVMAGVQQVLAMLGLWSLASFGGGAAGLLAALVVARLPRHGRAEPRQHAARAEPAARDAPAAREAPAASDPRTDGAGEGAGDVPTAGHAPEPDQPLLPLPFAFLAYIVLVLVVATVAFWPALAAALDRVELGASFPATQTSRGWENTAGGGRTISVFGHPGALIAYACLATYLLYARMGRYRPGALGRIARSTARGARAPSLAVLFLVGMAAAMSESGMTYALAEGVGRAFGPAYPLAAPFIGAIGAFVTGSNNNSNVLFSQMQVQAAELLRLPVPVILAAQNAGGALGSVFSPAKIVVGVSTVGLAGAESAVLRRVLGYGLAILAILAVGVWLFLR